MRRKLYLGLSLAAFAGLVAGGLFFTQSIGAQDTPKKAEPEQKKDISDLFDILKKDLELKKDVPSNLPTLTLPPPVATPTPEPKKVVIPPPTVQATKEDKEPLPPPVLDAPKKEVPLPTPPKAEDKKADTLTFPPITSEKPGAIEPKPPVVANTPAQTLPLPEKKIEVLPQAKSEPEPVKTLPRSTTQPAPTLGQTQPGNLPTVQVPSQRPSIDVAKNPSSPWSLHVEMIDGQTIVTATVNKKHEFRIVCASLDLQTGKGTLKASGKVQISGDMINGNCEALAISLLEDRLVLEGGATVTIQKVTSTVSDAKPAAFELKGEKLDLRISQLESEKFLQTSWRRVDDGNVRQASATAPSRSDRTWTRYGTLRRNESKVGPEWILVGSTGEVIAHLVARDGGALDRFDGQTISVYGSAEQRGGRPVLVVTHIALP